MKVLGVVLFLTIFLFGQDSSDWGNETGWEDDPIHTEEELRAAPVQKSRGGVAASGSQSTGSTAVQKRSGPTVPRAAQKKGTDGWEQRKKASDKKLDQDYKDR